MDPAAIEQLTQAATSILPAVAAALAGLAQAHNGNTGAGSSGDAANLSARDTPDGTASLSPQAEQALKALKSLEALYGNGDGTSHDSNLRPEVGGSAGRGETARLYRLRQLYQRNVRQAFNNIDNGLADCISQLAGTHKVDRTALRRIIREVDVQLAEMGPNAYTREGQQKVEQILRTALHRAQTTVHAGTARSAGIADAIHRLAGLYVRDLAGLKSNSAPTGSTAIDAAIRVARGEVGVREYGVNHVQRPYNIDDAWCASFATWAWQQAGIHVRWSNKNYVPSVWSDATRMGLAARPSDARPGDLIVFPGQRHVGLVVARHGNTITTVEGNTTGGGMSGEGVRQKTHSLSDGFVGVVHPPK